MVKLKSYERTNRKRREYKLQLVKSWFWGLVKVEKWVRVRVKDKAGEKRMRKHWAELVATGKRIDGRRA